MASASAVLRNVVPWQSNVDAAVTKGLSRCHGRHHYFTIPREKPFKPCLVGELCNSQFVDFDTGHIRRVLFWQPMRGFCSWRSAIRSNIGRRMGFRRNPARGHLCDKISS